MKITVAAGEPKKKLDDWQVEDALRTLIRAQEIRHDGELMKLVTKLASKQKKAISDISDLKSAYNRLVDQKQPTVEHEDDDLNDDAEDKALEARIQAED
jgi:hypothetical protein